MSCLRPTIVALLAVVVLAPNALSQGMSLELSDTADLIVNGVDPGEWSGISVGSGDVNNDNAPDLIIGAQHADPGGNQNAGVTRIVFGPLGPGIFELASEADTTLVGISPTNLSGGGVATGDINNDGMADLIIGAWFANRYAGETYVLFGPITPGTRGLDTERDITVQGIGGESSGRGVASGDLNNDGVADLIIGASASGPSAGKTYVIFGPLGPGTLQLSAAGDIIAEGVNPDDRSGISVASGDVNNDGSDDLIIGANQADPPGRPSAGQTYVLFGPLIAGTRQLSTAADLTVNGIEPYSFSGESVASGDVNGDGVDDVIIGAASTAPGGRAYAGETYVLFGPLATGTLELATAADLALNGVDREDRSGRGVGSGDINNDGRDDVIIGAHFAAPGGRIAAGETYVVFGPVPPSPTPTPTPPGPVGGTLDLERGPSAPLARQADSAAVPYAALAGAAAAAFVVLGGAWYVRRRRAR